MKNPEIIKYRKSVTCVRFEWDYIKLKEPQKGTFYQKPFFYKRKYSL